MGWKSERHLWVKDDHCICNRCYREYPLHDKISNSYKCPECRKEVSRIAREAGLHKKQEYDADVRRFADVWGAAGLYM